MPKKEKSQDFAQRRMRVDCHALGHHGVMLRLQVRDDRVCAMDCKVVLSHVADASLHTQLLAAGESFEARVDDMAMGGVADLDRYASEVLVAMGQLVSALKQRMA